MSTLAPSCILALATLGGGTIDQIDVLAVDWTRGMVAYRLIHHEDADPGAGLDEEEAPACNYPGMQAWPRSGVDLGWYSVAHPKERGRVTVYPAGGECVPPAAKRELERAKREIAARGLDIEQRPASVAAERGVLTVTLAGKPVRIERVPDDPDDDFIAENHRQEDLSMDGMYPGLRGVAAARRGSSSRSSTPTCRRASI
jgi:hypothetical protein